MIKQLQRHPNYFEIIKEHEENLENNQWNIGKRNQINYLPMLIITSITDQNRIENNTMQLMEPIMHLYSASIQLPAQWRLCE